MSLSSRRESPYMPYFCQIWANFSINRCYPHPLFVSHDLTGNNGEHLKVVPPIK